MAGHTTTVRVKVATLRNHARSLTTTTETLHRLHTKERKYSHGPRPARVTLNCQWCASVSQSLHIENLHFLISRVWTCVRVSHEARAGARSFDGARCTARSFLLS